MTIKEEKALKFQERFLEFDKESLLNKLEKYWVKYRFLNEIRKLVNFENRKILDIGCAGPTSVLNLIEGERYGVDPLIDGLFKIYDLDKNIHWKNAYGEKLPYEDNFFDIVISSNALDHVENITDAIKEIKRVLKPEGILILIVDIFKKNFKRDERHPYTFVEKDVLDLLKDFKIIFKKLSEVNASFYKFLKGEDVEKKHSYFLDENQKEFASGELVIVAQFIHQEL